MGLLDFLFGSSSEADEQSTDAFGRDGYHPGAWRKHIPYDDPFEPHPYDRPNTDTDNDGYTDGFLEDGDM